MSEFDFAIVKNPRIFEQNRLPAHSDHLYYEDDSYEYGAVSGFRYSLNGMWKFAYAENYQLASHDFFQADYDCRAWADIKVPAHIQLEGYDKIAYVNTQYPWDGHEDIDPGEIPTDYNPTGSYVKYFVLPENMKKGPVYISFQGVESGFALWLNGHYVGYSEDSFTPAEFDLTEYVVEGENKLALQVYKYTAGSWCEDQDFFRFSGIFREVYLYTTPATHIRDMFIHTNLDEDFANAELAIDMDITEPGHIQLVLSDDKTDILNKMDLSKGYNTMTMNVRAPKLWSAEHPNLYDLKIVVYGENGRISEVIKEKVGFRRFEMIDNMMHLSLIHI